jgi:nicotinamidase/pyrazinamidase
MDVDAYSAFSDNAYSIFTPLAKILHKRGIEEVEIAGLALDYCVKFTATDSRKFGFITRLLRRATRAVDASSEEGVLTGLSAWGVDIV